MTELTYEGFPEELRSQVAGFDRVFARHLRDYDEVLPHVLMGDLARFLMDEACVAGAQSATLRQALLLLEQGMQSEDSRLQELIAVSFLENLDSESAGFPAIKSLFGPALEAQFESSAS